MKEKLYTRDKGEVKLGLCREKRVFNLNAESCNPLSNLLLIQMQKDRI
jgi:hypothetical protein